MLRPPKIARCSISPCYARTSRRSSPVSKRARRRSPSSTSRAFTALEAERKTLQTRTEELQARRNALSKQIGQLKAKGEIGRRRDGRGRRASKAELEASARAARRDPARAAGAAAGGAEPAARERAGRRGRAAQRRGARSRWGTPARRFDFRGPSDHVDLGAPLGLDFETGAKLSGSRFTFMKRPDRAAAPRARPVHARRADRSEHGYTECYTPYIVNARDARRHRPAAQVRGRHVRGQEGRRRTASRRPTTPTQYLISTSEMLAHQHRARRDRCAERSCRSS